MRTKHTPKAVALTVLLLATVLLFGATAQAQHHYKVTNLVSDIPKAAAITDANLVNPWGLTASATSPFWVSDNGTGLSTLYNGNTGAPQSLVVTIPSASGSGTGNPTGTVFNSTAADFEVAPGKKAVFLFATEDGTIQGWNPQVLPTTAVIKVPGSDSAVYKGLTLGTVGTANFLYAANFKAGTVDVFDTAFQPHTFSGHAFVDHSIPGGFAPFNVQNINGNIVVTYAKQDEDKHDDVAGAGNGFVRIFDASGTLLQKLQRSPLLNSPWGVALAPAGFGKFAGDLLIGQFGSGAIVACDPKNGRVRGVLTDDSLLPIRIDGLWALRFGNGGNGGPTGTLFFTAGIFGEAHGLFGNILPTTDTKKDADGDDDHDRHD
jgi:uncharacterized protein (TIGR03118 family)